MLIKWKIIYNSGMQFVLWGIDMRLLIAFGLILLFAGCVSQGDTSDDSEMHEKIAELEAKMTEMESELASMEEETHGDEHDEDTAIATGDEFTVWIDHFIIRRENYEKGEDFDVHVHVRRRDAIDLDWNGNVIVTVGEDSIERNLVLSKAGDDHHDYDFTANTLGVNAVSAEISDANGIIETQKGEISVK
jgi:hypothetical protein